MVCSNVTGRTKERIAQSKRELVLVRSPLLTSHKWRELVPSGRLVCRYHDVFLWCYVCFVLLRFRFYAFVEAAALRSTVLRYASAPIATCVSFSFFGDVVFSEYLFVPFPLSLCMERTSYVLSFRMVFFHIVTTGWIFDISLIIREFNPTKNQFQNEVNLLGQISIEGEQSSLDFLTSYDFSSTGAVCVMLYLMPKSHHFQHIGLQQHRLAISNFVCMYVCMYVCIMYCLGYSVLDAGLSCTKGVWYIYDWDTGSSILI